MLVKFANARCSGVFNVSSSFVRQKLSNRAGTSNPALHFRVFGKSCAAGPFGKSCAAGPGIQTRFASLQLNVNELPNISEHQSNINPTWPLVPDPTQWSPIFPLSWWSCSEFLAQAVKLGTEFKPPHLSSLFINEHQRTCSAAEFLCDPQSGTLRRPCAVPVSRGVVWIQIILKVRQII